jgi:hypothetical protein
MNNKSIAIKSSTSVSNIISSVFGISVFTAGVINTFWGEPAGFGIFLMLLSFAYFLNMPALVTKLVEWATPRMGILKILLALFIIWVTLGVGNLFAKMEAMLNSL